MEAQCDTLAGKEFRADRRDMTWFFSRLEKHQDNYRIERVVCVKATRIVWKLLCYVMDQVFKWQQ